jgi:hypothetical protein
MGIKKRGIPPSPTNGFVCKNTEEEGGRLNGQWKKEEEGIIIITINRREGDQKWGETGIGYWRMRRERIGGIWGRGYWNGHGHYCCQPAAIHPFTFQPFALLFYNVLNRSFGSTMYSPFLLSPLFFPLFPPLLNAPSNKPTAANWHGI